MSKNLIGFGLQLLWLVAACGSGGLDSHRVQVPTKLSFMPPKAAIVGVAMPAVEVMVVDEHEKPVTSARTTVTLALGNHPAGATLSGTVTVDAVNGVASFSDLRLDRSGTGYTLVAEATGLTRATSSPFNVTFPPAALVFQVPPSSTAPGEAIAPPVQVAVVDLYGNTVESVSVSVTLAIRANSAGATLTGQTMASVVKGVATFPNLHLDKPGRNYTLTASADGLGSVTSRPFNVEGFVAIGAGGWGHTCAVATWGAAYCWESDFWGQLGDGTGSVAVKPVDVSGELTFATVSAGNAHTCGLTISGAAYCWGRNWSGQLGDGSTSDSSGPVPVAGGLSFTLVSAGINSSCGVTTSGAAYCWGSNWSGQLGNGSTSDSTSPVPVAGGLTFTVVSVGGYGGEYSCGVTTAGKAYCWGANYSGQLGNGSTNDTREPVEVAGALTFVTVSVGGSWVYPESVGYAHACGVTTSGAVYCWGANHRGQLGDGSTTDSTTPIPVTGGLTFAMVSSGGWSSCGVTTSAAAYCWGSNDSGELGNGSNSHSSTPVSVAGGLKFATVDAAPADGQFGEYTTPAHTCGLSLDDVVYCWGSSWEGGSAIPVRISFP